MSPVRMQTSEPIDGRVSAQVGEITGTIGLYVYEGIGAGSERGVCRLTLTPSELAAILRSTMERCSAEQADHLRALIRDAVSEK